MNNKQEKTAAQFNAGTVPLAGTNLIEASAGTGKTYSIAILALRLIIEKQIPIQQILMVTYTVAAVAELEQRIRNFVYKAYAAAQGKQTDDDLINELVTNAISDSSAADVQALLHAAVVYLDETSVLTIHSFCQQVLSEFAFETQQLFGAGLITDQSDILLEEVQKFWRKYVTTLPVPVLKAVPGLTIASISNIVMAHLSGKKYYYFETAKDYTICNDHHKGWEQLLADKAKYDEARLKDFSIFFESNKQEIVDKIEKNATLRKIFTGSMETADDFRVLLIDKYELKTIAKVFGNYFEAFEDLLLPGEEAPAEEEILNHIYCAAIKDVSKGIEKYLATNNLMTFDDLIKKLHEAIVLQDNARLVRLLQLKYKAVFIDEFQDTDKLQYEIFEKAFSGDSVLFYIGDPKQSIYAFRAADIFTYLKAKAAVANLYTMNDNYRSARSYINAMNNFFEPVPKFDTFYFQDEEMRFDYIAVDAPEGKDKGILYSAEEEVAAINISKHKNKQQVADAVAARITMLLTGEYHIEKNGEKRRIRASDIGVLVSKGKEANQIKHALAARQVPAVTVSDARIFDGEDAEELWRILVAIFNKSLRTIHTALLCNYTGFTTREIRRLDDDKVLGIFTRYHELWLRSGVFATLSAFVTDFNVSSILLQDRNVLGQRLYANLLQLMELLYKTERVNNFSPKELIDWYERAINDRVKDDAYVQRIEREEEAVTIATVHKSKGLQYNIVVLPFLDYKFRARDLHVYREPVSEEYISKLYKRMSNEEKKLLTDQAEQEYRRLLYVAVTRAVYCAFIYSNASSYSANSTLDTFLKELPQTVEINFDDELEVDDDIKYKPTGAASIYQPEPLVLAIEGNDWTRSSYSRLAANLPHGPKGRVASYNDEYEQFVFREMLPGKQTGNLLHLIFETINFTDNARWDDLLKRALQRFDPKADEGSHNKYRQLLDHVLGAKFVAGEQTFTLSGIAYNSRIHELEFDFPVASIQPSVLENIFRNSGLAATFKTQYTQKGILNGFIDLVFMHDEKYYVLDWKSTYLGGKLEDYAHDQLRLAMDENNYHLQYLLYTVAIRKYLESRLEDFNYERDFGGVFYAFVRGMRTGSESGIYFYKPDISLVDQMEAMFYGVEV